MTDPLGVTAVVARAGIKRTIQVLRDEVEAKFPGAKESDVQAYSLTDGRVVVTLLVDAEMSKEQELRYFRRTSNANIEYLLGRLHSADTTEAATLHSDLANEYEGLAQIEAELNALWGQKRL